MKNIPEKNKKEDTSVYKILQCIKTGTLDAKGLSKDDRQACVEVLFLEGHQISAIAQLLERSEKTIKRDLKEIWQRNSQYPTPDFVLREITEMIHKGKVHQAHLMRIARSGTTPSEEKIKAEYNAWKIGGEMSKQLQSLGYLPTEPHKITGDLYHHTENGEKSISVLKDKLSDLIRVASEASIDDKEIEGHIKNIQDKIEKAEINNDIEKLQDKIDSSKESENKNDK